MGSNDFLPKTYKNAHPTCSSRTVRYPWMETVLHVIYVPCSSLKVININIKLLLLFLSKEAMNFVMFNRKEIRLLSSCRRRSYTESINLNEINSSGYSILSRTSKNSFPWKQIFCVYRYNSYNSGSIIRKPFLKKKSIIFPCGCQYRYVSKRNALCFVQWRK